MRQTSIQTPAEARILPPTTRGVLTRESNQPVLGVKRGVWRRDDEHALDADQAFGAIRDSVLKRDNFSCRYCCFKATKFQEVHHFDDNHSNNDPDNLLTTCNLCHQVHHLGMCGMRNAGFLAMLPEFTQTEVNLIARAYHVTSLIANQEVKDRLTGLWAIFRSRADSLKFLFPATLDLGCNLSSPLFMTEVLAALPDEQFAQRATTLQDVRLVATKEAFHPGQLEYYAVNLSAQFRPDNWAALTRQLLG